MRDILLWSVTAVYPLLIWVGLIHAQPRDMALLLGALAILRALGQWGKAQARFWWWIAVAGAMLAAFTAVFNQSLPLKLYPVVVNVSLLFLFGLSLRYGMPIVERLARMTEPQLDARGQRYTRRVTQIWCGFFVLNGGLAFFTAIWTDDRTWALYNGLIAYLLMGLLMGGEWLLRQWLRTSTRLGK